MKNVMSQNLLDRFSVPVPESGCILWTGCTSQGYGVIRAEGKLIKAHVASLEIHLGEKANGRCALHKCDTPSCINPLHLWFGDRSENARDRDNKDRVQHGEKHYASRLTDDQIRAIRADPRMQRVIADDYGITQSHVSRIKSAEVRRRA